MAKTKELQVEEQVIVEDLSVKDLWIRLECHFLLSNESKAKRTFGKIDKTCKVEHFPQNFSSSTSVVCCPEGVSKFAVYKGGTNTVKMLNYMIQLFSRYKAMLVKKGGHSSCSMAVHQRTKQYLQTYLLCYP